jgi:T6SS, Phospholipase effector Tle1-like, catalytic domain
MTRLIVCCDGTWNTPEQSENGVPSPTNVFKFQNALAPKDTKGVLQLVYYHTGVGTDGDWWERLAGGALGEGLDDHIRGAYHWLARTYQPGDTIHLLGFSRGAYTARSVGGMIGRCGLLDLSPQRQVGTADGWKKVDDFFAMYRKPNGTDGSAPPAAEKRAAKIHLIGVWDTVGSLGIPDDFALLNLIDDPKKHQFHDTELSDAVEHARHAVALDERRLSFSPTLWTRAAAATDMKQVWFPGVHGDVGGGYAAADLSDGPLGWMMDETAALGMGFHDGVRDRVRSDPLGVMHDSLTGIFRRLKKRPRPVPRVDATGVPVALHQSAVDRQSRASLLHANYWLFRAFQAGAPVQCDVFAREQWNYTGLYLEKGVRYAFAADGEWLDRSVRCDPAGPIEGGDFQIEELVYFARGIIDRAEDGLRKLSRNHQAELWWSRRVGNEPWFCLMGAIANGSLAGGEHEVFRIGRGATYTPKHGGYLYCFANDAWEAYGNNRGSVRLTAQVVGELASAPSGDVIAADH